MQRDDDGTAARRGTLVITGASRGIGAAVARLAAAHGYAVALNYARDRDGAQGVVDELRANGRAAAAFRANVAVEAEVVGLFEAATNELGPLSGLVNNAGITGGSARVVDVAHATLVDTLAVNVVGAFLCAREAIRRLARSRGGCGGAIVNVSSLAARLGGGNEWVHYAASKGALDTFTRGLAREVAADGIRVNAVAPGLIDTTLHATSDVPDRLAKAVAFVPLQRAGTVEEVAAAVLWLLSPAASYVTGAILDVGGGR